MTRLAGLSNVHRLQLSHRTHRRVFSKLRSLWQTRSVIWRRNVEQRRSRLRRLRGIGLFRLREWQEGALLRRSHARAFRRRSGDLSASGRPSAPISGALLCRAERRAPSAGRRPKASHGRSSCCSGACGCKCEEQVPRLINMKGRRGIVPSGTVGLSGAQASAEHQAVRQNEFDAV